MYCICYSANHCSIIGGGNVKTESQKTKIKSKTGSVDNVSQEPGGDHTKVMKVRTLSPVMCSLKYIFNFKRY